MNHSYKILIKNRLRGGAIYNSKKISKKFHKLYPNNEFLKDECIFWKKVYWVTRMCTRKWGIDNKRLERLNQLYSQFSEPSLIDGFQKIAIDEFTLNLDDSTHLVLLLEEYADIVSQDIHYQNYISKYGCENIEHPEINCLFSTGGGEGPYETETFILHNNDVVLDIGANMGIFSLLAMKRGVKMVYAFEPLKHALSHLNANIVSNNYENKIIPVPYALSNKSGAVSFIENKDNMGASRITDNDTESTCTINCLTLDEWIHENNIPKIDFIKADIEGSERDMLTGARNVIKRDHPRLAICTYHLRDDPKVIRDIILSIDPTYKIDQRTMKLYAW